MTCRERFARALLISFVAAVTLCAAASFTLAQDSGDAASEPKPFQWRGSDFTRLLFQTNSPVLESLITKDKLLIPRTETIGSSVKEAVFSPDGYWLAYLQKRYVSGILEHTPYYETRLSVYRPTTRHSYTIFEKTSTFVSNAGATAIELFGWSSKGIHFVEIDLKDDRTELEEFKAQRTLHSFTYSQLKTLATGGRVKHQTEPLKIGDLIGLHGDAPAVLFRRSIPTIPEIGVEAHDGLVRLIGSLQADVQLPERLMQDVMKQPSDVSVKRAGGRPVLFVCDSHGSRR